MQMPQGVTPLPFPPPKLIQTSGAARKKVVPHQSDLLLFPPFERERGVALQSVQNGADSG